MAPPLLLDRDRSYPDGKKKLPSWQLHYSSEGGTSASHLCLYGFLLRFSESSKYSATARQVVTQYWPTLVALILPVLHNLRRKPVLSPLRAAASLSEIRRSSNGPFAVVLRGLERLYGYSEEKAACSTHSHGGKLQASIQSQRHYAAAKAASETRRSLCLVTAS